MKLRPNMTLCEVFAAEAAEVTVDRLLEQEDEDWAANWQPTPGILAWYRRFLSVMRDCSLWGAPSTGQIYLLSHRRKTFTLVYGNPNDSQHWHDKNKVTLDKFGYRVLDRPEVPPDDPEQVKKSLENFKNILPPEEFAKLSATALGPPPSDADWTTVTEADSMTDWIKRNRKSLHKMWRYGWSFDGGLTMLDSTTCAFDDFCVRMYKKLSSPPRPPFGASKEISLAEIGRAHV